MKRCCAPWLSLFCLAFHPVAAPQGAPRQVSTEEKIQRLEEQVRELLQEIEKLKKEVADKPSPVREKARAGWDKHPYLSDATGEKTLEIEGYGHADFRASNAENVPTSTFLIRRMRFGASGSLHSHLQFKFLLDAADTQSTMVRDAFITVKLHRLLSVQTGQFKEPFSFEQLRSGKYIDFVERAMISGDVAPGRDLGVMISGSGGRGVFSYQLGLFNGQGMLARDRNGDKEVAARLSLQPLAAQKQAPGFLHLGLAVTSSEQSLGVSQSGRTATGMSFFKGLATAGRRQRLGAEAAWYQGPLGLYGEYIQSREPLLPPATGSGVLAQGWYVAGSYALTGEGKSWDGSLKPKKSVFQGGRGAWELAARIEQLRFEVQRRELGKNTAFTLGLNWWLNANLVWKANLGWDDTGQKQASFLSRLGFVF